MCSLVAQRSVIDTVLVVWMIGIHDRVYFLHAFRFTRNYQIRKYDYETGASSHATTAPRTVIPTSLS
jgi:hypothetical protein